MLSPELRRRKTRHNISSKIDLSNDFKQKNAKICDFFAFFAPNARARVRHVCMSVRAGVFCVLDGSLGLLGRLGDGGVQGWGGSPVARGSGWSRTQVGLVGRVRQVGPAIGKKYYHSGNPTDIACPEAQNLSNT